MKIPFLFCLLLSGLLTSAQRMSDATIDSRALQLPSSRSFSPDSIAAYFNENFSTEYEKLRAVHIWTAANIKYDSDSVYALNIITDDQVRVNNILRRKKGVCEQYAAVFFAIAEKCGLTAYIVNGYTKQNGNIDRTGHSWCAVLLNDEWRFCDPTWDKDRYSDTKYFIVTPEEMIRTHMPFDPMWQALDHPVSHKEFYAGYRRAKANNIWQAKDTISDWRYKNELAQLQDAARRTQQAGVANDLVKNDVAVNNMNIEMLKEDKDADLYNSCLSSLNNATSLLNDFIQYRNAQFQTQKTPEQLNSMLTKAQTSLSKATDALHELSRSSASMRLETEGPQAQLERLSKKLKEQKEFLQKYTSTAATSRGELFYQ